MGSASILVYLFAVTASFFGSIPFGVVNLTVIETTLRKTFRDGWIMSLGAATIEMLHGFLAVYTATYFTSDLEDNLYIQVFVLGLLLILAVFFLTRKNQAPEVGRTRKNRFRVPEYFRGAFFSLINPQALPYYVFVIAYFSSHGWGEIGLEQAIPFVLGVATGRFLSLLGFAWFSARIQSRMGTFSQWMNLVMGGLFLVLALFQSIKLLN